MYNNTSCGYRALITNTTGYNNTAIGYLANVSNAALNNATAIGYNASTTATNMMYLGNANALLYCATGVWTGSDGRFKTNVTENVKGLEFINKLRPVTYNMNTSVLDDFLIQNLPDSIKTLHKAGMDFVASTAIVHSGFIAQEVEQASQQVGFTSSIVHAPDNGNTHFALNYAEIVVPLVKAVQELNKIADSLQTKTTMKDSINTAVQSAQQQKIDNLETQKHSQDSVNVSLQIQLNQLLSNINSCCVINGVRSNTQSQSSTQQIDVKLTDAQTIVLEQNVPNPFAEETAINYSLADNTVKAQMLFYNAQGKLIQSTELTQKGKGTLNVFASDLSSGIYTYTLVVDGKIIETKKMVKQ